MTFHGWVFVPEGAREATARIRSTVSRRTGVGRKARIARREAIVLYTPPTALRHLALLLMLPVFPLLFAAYLPGRISAAARHPMLLAVKLWATAHLLANGTLADVLLFGGFVVWAIADRISVKRRSAAEAHDAPAAPRRPANDVIAVVAGLLVYAVLLLGGHRWIIGVSPLG